MNSVMKKESPATTNVRPITTGVSVKWDTGLDYVRSEWNIMPASKTIRLREAFFLLASSKSTPDLSVLSLALIISSPIYSIKKDRNRPAIRMADVVAS